MSKFHVSATGHTVNYFPEYLARELGYFAEEQLDVTASVPQPWTVVLDDLESGEGQAALGGIWVPSMYHGRVRGYKAFAQVSARCPITILARSATRSDFSLNQLAGSTTLVTGGNGASPFIFLRSAMKEAKVDCGGITFVHDLATPMLLELFLGGMGDFLVVDALTAETVSRKHDDVYVAAHLAEIGGRVPWSVYYCKNEKAEGLADSTGRFTRALDRAIRWIREHDATDALEIIEKVYPKADPKVVVGLVNDFRRFGMWETARIDAEALDRWQHHIADAGLVDRPLAYDEIVDSSSADFAGAPATRSFRVV